MMNPLIEDHSRSIFENLIAILSHKKQQTFILLYPNLTTQRQCDRLNQCILPCLLEKRLKYVMFQMSALDVVHTRRNGKSNSNILLH